jgi:hypothetical protein
MVLGDGFPLVALSEIHLHAIISDVDVERARLLHHYPLHQCRPDAQRLADGSRPSLKPIDPGQACVRSWGGKPENICSG